MVRDANELKVNPLALLRHGATAVAVARVALGVVALARPSVPARPWVGEPADEIGLQVLGRALGARDLVLGLGTLAAARESLPGGGKTPPRHARRAPRVARGGRQAARRPLAGRRVVRGRSAV